MPRAALPLALALTLLAPAASRRSVDASCDPGTLRCTELIPVPDLRTASGVLDLTPSASPFGTSVTADGHPRYRLSATIAGLPDVRALGGAAYVAWAYTIALDSEVRLGVVRNGRNALGEIHYDQFRILISAERSADARTRTGRLVLRGTSPSARLLAHRDLVQPAAFGSLRDTARTDAGRWTMPDAAMRQMMMPGMSGLVPSVAPWRPSKRDAPPARPRSVVTLRDGDTLALDARIVTRAIAGRTITMYGFNGEYPGPLVRVDRGATITVLYTNSLDQPSAVHWHGVRLDNRFDGVPGVTQHLVPPGGRFTYRVHFRDAGLYWYHPHEREDAQQDLGLYGNLFVRSPDPREFAPVNREEILMLDDIALAEDGVAPYGAEAPTHALMGRFGDVMLVNGEPRYALDVKQGDVVRFWFTDAASARTFNVSFVSPNGAAPMKLVAGDASRFEREQNVESVVISPAERYAVDVRFPTSGRYALVNRVQALDHMLGVFHDETDTLGVVTVSSQRTSLDYEREFASLRGDGVVAREVAAMHAYETRAPDRILSLGIRTHDLPAAVSNMLTGLNVPVDWNDGMAMMNWLATGREVTWVIRDSSTGRENMDIDWRVKRGSIEKLRIVNDGGAPHAMGHPMHLHGQRFLVLARNGVPVENRAWKDTALLPAGETMDLLIDFANPGAWMLHCHIAEHLSAGMMTVVHVE